MAQGNTQLILGAGRTGLAAVRYFQQHQQPVMLFDDNDHVLQTLSLSHDDVHVLTGDADCIPWQAVERVIISPGIPITHPVVQVAQAKHVAVMSDVAYFAQQVSRPIVTITGTNGKSTVTTLLGHLLEAAKHRVLLGGNLGTPVLDLLLLPPPDYYVLELSSFQLQMIHHMPIQVGCLLNVSQDHLDRHHDFDEYIHAKCKPHQWSEYVVFNRDDARTMPQDSNLTHSFGASADDSGWCLREHLGQIHLSHGEQLLMPVKHLPLLGQHNWLNVLAAMAMGGALGLDKTVMAQAVTTYQGLPHRCEQVRTWRGALWINDSKSTNVASARAALLGLQHQIAGQIIWIAGGLAKGQSFDGLVSACQRVKQLILLGQDADRLGQVFDEVVELTYVRDLREAVLLASEMAEHDDAVLLSPACASYDMFTHYADRGEQFKQLVWSLV